MYMYIIDWHTLTVVRVSLVNSLLADFTLVEGRIWIKPKNITNTSVTIYITSLN